MVVFLCPWVSYPQIQPRQTESYFPSAAGNLGCESTGANLWIQGVSFHYTSTWMLHCVGGLHPNPTLFKGKLHIFFKIFF